MSGSLKKRNLLKNNKTIFIRCGCQNELLVLDYDEDIDMIELCMYQSSVALENQKSLWYRIRQIYQIIKYGFPFRDQIVLERSQIEELKTFLNTLQKI